MNCVKCGREIENDQVFCQTCLEAMEAYPVKPGTVVHIPKHPEDENEKKPAPRKKVLTPEEQIRRLKKKVLGLRIGLAVMLLICGLLCFAVGRAASELDFYRFLGKNYNTVETPPTKPAATVAPTEAPTETRWLPEITEP